MTTSNMSCSPEPARGSRWLFIGYIVMSVLFVGSFAVGIAHSTDASEDEPQRQFTEAELSAFDGKDGSAIYVSYEGVIYDVSDSPLFKEGEHFGHLTGKDLTDEFGGAPHGEEVFERFDVVGTLKGYAPVTDTGSSIFPIRFLGKSISAWTGYIFGLFFILNFGTCYVMPWCCKPVPWKGKTPGRDRWDAVRLRLNYYHGYIAWLTIIFGILHGVLGIMSSFGYVI